MKKNEGITVITLAITIIVIIILASITIYTGINTINSVRKKGAYDIVNAIYLSLMQHEDIIPVNHSQPSGEKLAETSSDVIGRQLFNDDFRLLEFDYTIDNCTVVFNRKFSQTVDHLIEYEFTYTDELNKTYSGINYSYFSTTPIKQTIASFDKDKKVNRPVLLLSGMVAKKRDGTDVNDVYVDNWYDYNIGVSQYATMQYQGDTYVWIPRFAYRVQSFYLERNYQNVPTTAIDILFLREDTNYMENGETLTGGYRVHPAFENGLTGFWIMLDNIDTTNSIDNAITATNDIQNASGEAVSHLMKNSEYAATIMLSQFLGNSQIRFDEKEFVGAVCETTIDHFDSYSLDNLDLNYIKSIKGHALYDTPWNLKKENVEPSGSNVFFVRDVTTGGEYYFEAVPQVTTAAYRRVITVTK